MTAITRDAGAALEALAAASAEARESEAVFQAAAAASGDLVGHTLFTVMRFDPDRMEVERAFSTDPGAYPAGGRKPKRDTPWGTTVLIEGRPFIGPDAEAIRKNFSDHETIAALGLTTVLNVPVRTAGRTVGTVNLLRAGPPYQAEDIGPIRLVAGLMASWLVGPAPDGSV